MGSTTTPALWLSINRLVRVSEHANNGTASSWDQLGSDLIGTEDGGQHRSLIEHRRSGLFHSRSVLFHRSAGFLDDRNPSIRM